MPNSEKYNFIVEKLDNIETITAVISKTLDNNQGYDMGYIRNLDELYLKRKTAIEALKSIMRSITSLADKSVSARINNLIEKDKYNLDRLNKKVVEIRSKLRNLDKQKSVLIYSKSRV